MTTDTNMSVTELVKEFGMEFEVDQDFDLANIKSRSQVRDESNRAPAKAVEAYSRQIKYGGFPPIVVYKTPSGKFELVDGNTREKACLKVDRHTFPAIVITKVQNAADIVALGAALNSRNGERLSKAEIERLAVRMAEGGYSNSKIEQRLGVSNTLINRILSVRDTEQRLKKLFTGNNIGTIPMLKSDQKRVLGSKEAKLLLDKQYLDLVWLSADAGLSGKEITDLRKEVQATGDAKEQDAILKKARAGNTERIDRVKKTGIGTPPPARMLTKHLGSVLKCTDAAKYVEVEPTKAKTYLDDVLKAVRYLADIAKAQQAFVDTLTPAADEEELTDA